MSFVYADLLQLIHMNRVANITPDARPEILLNARDHRELLLDLREHLPHIISGYNSRIPGSLEIDGYTITNHEQLQPPPHDPPRRLPLTRDWVEYNIVFHEQLGDFDRVLNLTGEIKVQASYRLPNHDPANDSAMTRAKDHIINELYQRVISGYNIDDVLRNYLFWLHQNIKPELRAEADTSFESMRNQIWPAEQPAVRSV